MYIENKFDSLALGQAIKKARESKGWSREKVAEMVDRSPRHIMYIENRGIHPSLQKLYELVKIFDVKVDPYFFPDIPVKKSSRRCQLDTLLDMLDEKDYIVLEATAKGLIEAKAQLSG